VVNEPTVGERFDYKVRLRISALSEKDIDGIIKELDEICNEMIKEHVIGSDSKDSELIAQLSDEQVP
jgi:hypothetical protein